MGTKIKQGRRLALVLALLLAFNALLPSIAHAGTLTNTYVRLNRMQTGVATTFRVVFKTSATPGTVDTLKVDFGTAWTSATPAGVIGASASQTASSATCAAESGATALPGTLTASSAASAISVAGVTAASIVASTAYCVDFTFASAVTNPAAGNYLVVVTTQQGATVNDTAKVSIPIVANDSITVTAVVPPTFTFALDANTTSFTANLSPGTKQVTTGRTITINTNAKTGWVAWLRNSTANGLYSSSVNYNVAPTTPGTSVTLNTAPNTEQYVWGVKSATQVAGVGTTSVVAAYDATGTADGSGVDQTYRQIASGNGTSQNAVLTIVAGATISPITPAASDYSDTVQVIGAGNF